jgi:hypothetical protein
MVFSPRAACCLAAGASAAGGTLNRTPTRLQATPQRARGASCRRAVPCRAKCCSRCRRRARRTPRARRVPAAIPPHSQKRPPTPVRVLASGSQATPCSPVGAGHRPPRAPRRPPPSTSTVCPAGFTPASASARRKPSASVLSPMSRAPSQNSVLTAPMCRAASVSPSSNGMTASLCGIVRFSPPNAQPAHPCNRLRQPVGGDLERQVDPVQPQRAERRVMHRGRERVAHGIAQHARQCGVRVDHPLSSIR